VTPVSRMCLLRLVDRALAGSLGMVQWARTACVD